jgi:branched-subunit amino acid aminotransferase/4-amino-4-deoxychorismate lyase
VYRLERHFDRLRRGAETLGIALPLGLADLAAVVRRLADRCGLEDARVRLTLTAGPEGGQPSVLIQARPVTNYPQSLYERGLSALVASIRRNETSPLSRVKSLNYLENLLARQQARHAGADEALFLNTRGLIADGSATTIFFFLRDELVTPRVEDGALPGITREAVLELACAAGIPIQEASLTLDDLGGAQEAFLANAVGGVMPLVSVEGTSHRDGRPGAITHRLRGLYEEAAATQPQGGEDATQ